LELLLLQLMYHNLYLEIVLKGAVSEEVGVVMRQENQIAKLHSLGAEIQSGKKKSQRKIPMLAGVEGVVVGEMILTEEAEEVALEEEVVDKRLEEILGKVRCLFL
jgi:hypothetical protein